MPTNYDAEPGTMINSKFLAVFARAARITGSDTGIIHNPNLALVLEQLEQAKTNKPGLRFKCISAARLTGEEWNVIRKMYTVANVRPVLDNCKMMMVMV